MRVWQVTLQDSNDVFELRQDDAGQWLCPVCGFVLGAGPRAEPWELSVDPDDVDPGVGTVLARSNYTPCSCCLTEFGVDDNPGRIADSVTKAWQILRTRWLDMAGWSRDAVEQVTRNLGLTEGQLRLDAADNREQRRN